MTNQVKKDRVIRLAKEFAERRGYYLNYDSTFNHDQGIRSTCFRFSHNGRGPEVVEVVWDEVDDIGCVFAKLRDYVDGCFKPTNATTFLDPATKTFLDRLGAKPKSVIPSIEKVVFNDPATIVFWADKTKTVVKCGPNDIYDPEKGLAMAISKKALGNQGNYYNTIKKWLPEDEADSWLYSKLVDEINRINDRLTHFVSGLNFEKYNKRLEEEEPIMTTTENPPYYLWYHGPDSMAWHKRNYAYKDKRNAERYAKRHFPDDWEWTVSQDEIWAKDSTEPEDYTWDYLRGEKE